MASTWQVQEAKAHFSELLAQAMNEGPQTITKHGKERAVVVSYEEFLRLSESRPSFRDFLLSGPQVDDFEVTRDADTGRDIDL